jgi:hypothetical protein
MPGCDGESARAKKLPFADAFASRLGPFVLEGSLFAHLDRFVDGEMRWDEPDGNEESERYGLANCKR